MSDKNIIGNSTDKKFSEKTLKNNNKVHSNYINGKCILLLLLCLFTLQTTVYSQILRNNYQSQNNLYDLVMGVPRATKPTSKNLVATLTVTKTDDTNDGVCDADCSLREAIDVANTVAGDDVIEFSASVFGTTQQTITLNGTELLISTGRVTIIGPGANLLTIDGNNLSRAFYVDTPAQAAITNLTITNGVGVGSDNGFGGGIANRGILAVDECVITNNTASIGGGGILNELGQVQIFDSTISNNTAHNGGAIRSNIGNLTVENSTFDNNTANNFGGSIELFRGATFLNNTNVINSTSTVLGGGILAQGASSSAKAIIEINNSNISNNSAGNAAGAILTFFADATVTNTKFNNNTALVAGGAIRHDNGATFQITDSTIDNNSTTHSAGFAGAILNSGLFVAVRSTISNNSSTLGGAILNQANAQQFALDNSTVSGNTATNSGGAILNSGTLNLFTSTIAKNSSGSVDENSGGGGIKSDCTDCFFSLSSIIADNVDDANVAPDFLGELTSDGHNLIGSTAGTTIVGDTI